MLWLRDLLSLAACTSICAERKRDSEIETGQKERESGGLKGQGARCNLSPAECFSFQAVTPPSSWAWVTKLIRETGAHSKRAQSYTLPALSTTTIIAGQISTLGLHSYTTCGLTLHTHRCAWLDSCAGVCVMDIYRSFELAEATSDWLLSAGPAQRAGFNLKPTNSIIITAGWRGWRVCTLVFDATAVGEVLLRRKFKQGNEQGK